MSPKTFPALLALLPVLATSGVQAPKPVLTPFHPNGIYHLGEKTGWHVNPSGATGKWTYTIKENNKEIIKSGKIDAGDIEVSVTEPAMLYLQLSSPEGGRPLTYGAAIEPLNLKPVLKRPADFDSFWKRKIAELEAVPAKPVLTPAESGKDGVDYATIQMDHVNGTHVYGQFAKPSKPGKYPAVLMLQWASPPYPLQRAWITDLAARGYLALDIEPHDVLPREPQSYYNDLPAALKNYTSINQSDREKSYFVEMYLRDYRAVDYLAQRSDWDGKTLIVMGTSMGGQQSLCVSGLHPKITHVIVEEPSGCDLNGELHGRQVGYPYFPTNDPKAMETAQYIDCINFASRIKATALVAMGFVDNVAAPAGIWTAFNQIRGPKEAAPMLDAPHNNIATQEQQRPYTVTAYLWLDTLAKGGKVQPKR